MDIALFKKELMRDEGYVEKVYICPAGYPTVGCGHKLRPIDFEYGSPVGTPVATDRCQLLLEWDVKQAINDCQAIYSNYHVLPQPVQHVLANMAFNIGQGRLRRFIRMNRHIEEQSFDKAADEMVASRWYHQVGDRSIRLVAEMRAASLG
jgi:lysozyme